MDATRFDALTRGVSTRRGVIGGSLGGGLAALLGLATGEDAGAKPKRCKRGKKKCGGKCIPKSQCCKTADCGGGQICAKGTCVVGQGTCGAGENFCSNSPRYCGSASQLCGCLPSTEGDTRCAASPISEDCGSTSECVARHPQVPGIFCAVLVDDGFCNPGTDCRPPCEESRQG